MDKLKYIKLENEDGSYSSSIPLAVDSDHVDVNGNPLTDELNNKANNSSIVNLQNQINSLASGSPLVASSVSEMTDTSRIYVNSTDGHWYWYDGSSWRNGGVYQATGISAEEIQNINIKSKNIRPNSIAYFKGYDLADRYNTDPAILYDTAHRTIEPSSSDYVYLPQSANGRCIKTRIPQNTYITINKEISDRFRVALYVNEPVYGTLPGKLICDDATITNIGFNTEIYNWMVVFYTMDNDNEIDIEVLIENIIDYNSLLRENNIDIFDKVECDNVFDKELISKGFWLGDNNQKYSYLVDKTREELRSFIFPLIKDETYNINKSLTGRFRVGLFINHPVNFDGSVDTVFDGHPQKIIIDDETQTTCEFNSENYRYCVITYTITGEDVDMTITNSSNTKYVLKKEYVKDIVEGSFENYHIVEAEGGCIISNKANSSNDIWTNWDNRLAFGMNINTTPVPLRVKSQLLVDGTCIVRNQGNQNYNRWGFHVYEAYGKNNYDRITMLMNKHDNEINKKVAELYYYTGANHYASSYAWYRLGSDVKNHSFMFDRDTFVAYGISDLRNVMTLARISPSNDLITTYNTVAEADAHYEPESNAENNAKCLLYIALRNAENGSMFYDIDRDKIVVKVNNVWCDMDVTPVPVGTYNF